MSWIRKKTRLLHLLHCVSCCQPKLLVFFSAPQDYPLLVAIPMDLGTVKSKLLGGQYRVPKELIQDIKLIFANAKAYNEPRSQVMGV